MARKILKYSITIILIPALIITGARLFFRRREAFYIYFVMRYFSGVRSVFPEL